MLIYKTIFSNKARRDLIRIAKFMENYNSNKIIERIYKSIDDLNYMPRIHKTLTYFKDKNGEYRRMLTGKYSIIYKIENNQIIILRIFNQKENYLNQRKFILREEKQSYFIGKRRVNMMKLRTLKNSYARLKEKFTKIVTEEEILNKYMNMLIDEVENVPEEERIYYTHEEFWKMVTEKEIERYGHPI